jgi:hypothetical protein
VNPVAYQIAKESAKYGLKGLVASKKLLGLAVTVAIRQLAIDAGHLIFDSGRRAYMNYRERYEMYKSHKAPKPTFGDCSECDLMHWNDEPCQDGIPVETVRLERAKYRAARIRKLPAGLCHDCRERPPWEESR